MSRLEDISRCKLGRFRWGSSGPPVVASVTVSEVCIRNSLTLRNRMGLYPSCLLPLSHQMKPGRPPHFAGDKSKWKWVWLRWERPGPPFAMCASGSRI